MLIRFHFPLDYSDIYQSGTWTESDNHPHYHHRLGILQLVFHKYGMYRRLYVIWRNYVYILWVGLNCGVING